MVHVGARGRALGLGTQAASDHRSLPKRDHVIGGESAGLNFPSSDDDWSSSDGVRWTKHPNPPVKRAGVTALATLCDKLFLIGGCTGPRSSTRSATTRGRGTVPSGSSAVRVQQSAEAPWPGRMWNGVVAYDDKLWVCAGRIADGVDIADCWCSEDLGVTWQ